MKLMEKITNELNEANEDEWHVSNVRRLVYKESPKGPSGPQGPKPPQDNEKKEKPKGKAALNMAPPGEDDEDEDQSKEGQENDDQEEGDSEESHVLNDPKLKNKDGQGGGGGGANYKHHFAGERVKNIKTGKEGIIKKINPDGTVEVDEISEAMKNLFRKIKG